MKIFVTGGTGCLGGNVIDYLIEHTNHNVVAGVRDTSNIARLSKLPIEIKILDFVDYNDVVKNIPNDIDAIIHCAGNTSYQKYERDIQFIDNVVVTRNLVSAAENIGSIRFVHTSTIATLPARINNNYGLTKLQAERVVLASELSSIILRPGVLIGKHDTKNYYRMFKLIQDNKYPVALPRYVDFCDAYEVAKAHVFAAENTLLHKEYTLGGYESDWFTVGNKIAQIIGSKGPSMIAPKSLLHAIAVYGELKGKFFNQPADFTYDFFDLVFQNSVVTRAQKIASARDLGYNYTVNIDSLIRRYVIWAKSEKLL